MTVSIVSSSETKLISSSDSSRPSVVIVDCGSGYSRVANFYLCSETRLVHSITTRSHIRALHTVIHSPTESAEWVHELIEIVKQVDSEATEVMIGATGGVRDLISCGEITMKEVETFQELLTNMELPFRVTMVILSGEDEAKYEFLSAKYCAEKCGLLSEEEEGMTYLGLLSSGGMSSQISVKGVSRSLETEVKKGNRLGLEHGMEKGKALFHRHVTEAIEQNIPKNFGGEDVLYVAIEMLAAVGEKAGMGGGVMLPVAAAIQTLSNFIEEKTKEDALLGETVERTWKTYVHVMSGIVGKIILGRLHPESRIVFLWKFELGEDHALKPSWPLGHAIEKLLE